MEKLHEVHEIELSYSWVKTALQKAGLVAKKSKRGVHRKRRARRRLIGMLLQVDGSKHAWLMGRGLQDLIVVFDDATSEVDSAQLVREESTATEMADSKEVVETKGVFCALYANRASHLVYTPKAGGPPEPNHRTQIGRALEQPGIELIAANSPQARGRCERLFGSWQGRLPQELRLRGITSLAKANRFLREEWIDFHNQRFSVESEQPGSAFVPAYGADLERIFSCQEHRVVGNDNTIRYQRKVLQIEPQRFRYSMARCRVLVCEHLDGKLSFYYGLHRVGLYDAEGQLLAQQNQAAQYLRCVQNHVSSKERKKKPDGKMENAPSILQKLDRLTGVSHFPTASTTTEQL